MSPPAPFDGSDEPDEPAHVPNCKLAVTFVRASALGSIFIRAGGWPCPGCAEEKSDAILEQLAAVVDTPALWLGELTSAERNAANRQARRYEDAGRVVATRHGAPCLMLASANLTPRSRALRPVLARRGITTFVTELRDGPTPKRVDWADSWRPQPEKRRADPAVRAGMGPIDLVNQAIANLGFRTGVAIPGLSDIEIAEAVDAELGRLRYERDSVTWEHKPKQAPIDPPSSPLDKTHGVS